MSSRGQILQTLAGKLNLQVGEVLSTQAPWRLQRPRNAELMLLRKGRQQKTFLPNFPALLSLSMMEIDNQVGAAHLSCQGPHQKRKAKSQGTGDPIEHSSLQLLSRRNRRETSSLTCMGKCVVPFPEEQKFTSTCVAWELCVFGGERAQ